MVRFPAKPLSLFSNSKLKKSLKNVGIINKIHSIQNAAESITNSKYRILNNSPKKCS